jgi:hypothetical protein
MQGNWAEAEKLQGTQWIGDDLEKKLLVCCYW